MKASCNYKILINKPWKKFSLIQMTLDINFNKILKNKSKSEKKDVIKIIYI